MSHYQLNYVAELLI